jgi:DNA-binding CsgD family transcriptional regulator
MTDLPRASSPDLSPLGVLGLTARDESIYRLVLRNSGASIPSLAAQAALRLGELREHLTRLAGVGLIDVRSDHVAAHPPQEALGRLLNAESRRVHSRNEQLDAVRSLLPSLSADHLASSAPKGEELTVEVLEGRDLAKLIRSLSATSAGEMLWLRPDPLRLAPGEEIDEWVLDQLRLGRGSRAIYCADILREAPDLPAQRAAAGERVRLLPRVPTRLAVLGGSAALIAESFEIPDRRLVLRHPSMVAALASMFEGLWEKAVPLPGFPGQRYDAGVSDRRKLLDQLVAGAKDEQIARALGVSVRTVRRRVAELMEELGADSRFQAGVHAAGRRLV